MEKDIEKAGTQYAEKRGFLVRKFKTPGRRNAPDRIHFGPGGLCFFIEYKDAGEKPRPGQVREAEKLRALGFDVHFIDNAADAKKVIDSYAAGRNPAKADALDAYASKWTKLFKFSGEALKIGALIVDLKETAEGYRKDV